MIYDRDFETLVRDFETLMSRVDVIEKEMGIGRKALYEDAMFSETLAGALLPGWRVCANTEMSGTVIVVHENGFWTEITPRFVEATRVDRKFVVDAMALAMQKAVEAGGVGKHTGAMYNLHHSVRFVFERNGKVAAEHESEVDYVSHSPEDLHTFACMGVDPIHVRTPEGHINNCALANGYPAAECQVCHGQCPDAKKFSGLKW